MWLQIERGHYVETDEIYYFSVDYVCTCEDDMVPGEKYEVSAWIKGREIRVLISCHDTKAQAQKMLDLTIEGIRNARTQNQ